MTTWHLVIGGVSGTLADWGVSRGSVRFVANGFDSLALDISPDAAAGKLAELAGQGAALDSVQHGTAVSLRRGSDTASATVFAGFVDVMELVADTASGLLQRYTVRNVLARLEKTPYTWAKSAYTAEGVEATFNDSCVILGQVSSANKARLTTGGQIAQILSYAKAKWSLGYVVHEDVASCGFQFPLDQRENITCWDGIVACLRWMPDHVLWCDYTGGDVTVRLKPQSALSSTTVDLLGGTVSDFRATPATTSDARASAATSAKATPKTVQRGNIAMCRRPEIAMRTTPSTSTSISRAARGRPRLRPSKAWPCRASRPPTPPPCATGSSSTRPGLLM